MEKLTLLAVVICVSSVWGAPERCCVEEEQFTVRKGVQSGVVGIGFFARFRGQMVVFEDTHLAFDYTNGRVAGYMIRRFLDETPEQHLHIIADLESGMAHVISPYEEECSKEDLVDVPFFPARCVSEIAFWTGNVTLGRGFIGDQWTTYFPDERSSPAAGVYSVMVNHETCMPVSESFAGRSRSWGRNQQIVTSIGYHDYSSGISDEAMEKFFTLPEYCAMEMDHQMSGGHEEEGTAHEEDSDHEEQGGHGDKPRKH